VDLEVNLTFFFHFIQPAPSLSPTDVSEMCAAYIFMEKRARRKGDRNNLEDRKYGIRNNDEEWCLLGCYAVWLL
jgi:hypothetical protein